MATGMFPEVPNEIDMREEITEFLSLHGHRGYLRKITNQRCGCWSENPYNEADPDCSTCSGTGFGYLDHEALFYRVPATGIFRGAMQEVAANMGLVGPGDAQFFLKSDTNPRQGDYIIEVEVDSDNNVVQAIRIERVWDINAVIPYRDRIGRVEFWACRSKRLDITK